jgi:hypothetical protein
MSFSPGCQRAAAALHHQTVSKSGRSNHLCMHLTQPRPPEQRRQQLELPRAPSNTLVHRMARNTEFDCTATYRDRIQSTEQASFRRCPNSSHSAWSCTRTPGRWQHPSQPCDFHSSRQHLVPLFPKDHEGLGGEPEGWMHALLDPANDGVLNLGN